MIKNTGAGHDYNEFFEEEIEDLKVKFEQAIENLDYSFKRIMSYEAKLDQLLENQRLISQSLSNLGSVIADISLGYKSEYDQGENALIQLKINNSGGAIDGDSQRDKQH